MTLEKMLKKVDDQFKRLESPDHVITECYFYAFGQDLGRWNRDKIKRYITRAEKSTFQNCGRKRRLDCHGNMIAYRFDS